MKATINLSTLIIKAALILTAVVFFASWAGCSDNMNLTDPLSTNHNVQKQPNSTPDQHSPLLIWSYDELKVLTNTEGFASNRITYVKPEWIPPQENISGYLITFNASTNADCQSNGFTAYARVTRNSEAEDEHILYEESVFNGTSDPYVGAEIKFGNVQFSEISFYIALFQMDNDNQLAPNNSIFLSLSDIKIYRLR